MSLERAYMNCERCYRLVNRRGSESSKGEAAIEGTFFSNDIHAARNEAMMALEEETVIKKELEPVPKDMYGRRAETSVEALRCCAICDFTKPNIADIVKGFISKKL